MSTARLSCMLFSHALLGADSLEGLDFHVNCRPPVAPASSQSLSWHPSLVKTHILYPNKHLHDRLVDNHRISRNNQVDLHDQLFYCLIYCGIQRQDVHNKSALS
jgi:hypothetical protein